MARWIGAVLGAGVVSAIAWRFRGRLIKIMPDPAYEKHAHRYGPKWRGERPPGLPQGVPHVGASGSAFPLIKTACAGKPALFTASLIRLCKGESGGQLYRPANAFDARVRMENVPAGRDPEDYGTTFDGNRPAGKKIITAYGCFQFNRDAIKDAGLDGFPWEFTERQLISAAVKKYEEVWDRSRTAGATEEEASTMIFLWHRVPFGIGNRNGFERVVKAVERGSSFQAEIQKLQSDDRSIATRKMRDAVSTV